jgi:hypothetical protein
MNAHRRCVLLALILILLPGAHSGAAPGTPPAAAEALAARPGDTPPRRSAPPAGNDKLLHFLAGLAAGLSGGGAVYALAPEAEWLQRPLAAGSTGLAAALLAGAGKEALDALRRQDTHSVEAADLLHTLLGGLTGGALAEALVRSGREAGLPARAAGIGLVVCGGALGIRVLRSAAP